MKENCHHHMRKKSIFFITIVSLIISIIVGSICYFIIGPTYSSSISILLYESQPVTPPEIPTDYDDTMMYQQMVKTYCEIAKSRSVAEDVITQLSLPIPIDELLSMVSVAPKANTQFLEIVVKSSSPALSAQIADQYGDSLCSVSSSIMDCDYVNVLDSAYPALTPDISNALYIGIIVFISCFILLCLLFYCPRN